MSFLPLSDIVNIIINVSPTATPRNAFNLGLIIGKATIISAVTRVKVYGSTDEMLSDGWVGTELEYLAALNYFAQNPRPLRVAIGRWDGTGAETAVQAVTACRVANTDWYDCMVCGAAKAEHISIAAYIETATPKSTYMHVTSDAEILAQTAGNVMDSLSGSKRRRTMGQYSSDADAVAAIQGYAMGANTGLDNSAYTLNLKLELGITPENLTSAQVAIIEGYKGNVYVKRGTSFSVFEKGTMYDGTKFDEVLYLDMMENDLQLAVMDLLTSLPKVPQTDGGVAMICNVLSSVCNTYRRIGFLAPGIWTGPQILGLKTGDTLSNGYAVLPDTIANQLKADRDARKSPPIYIPIKLAGAIESAMITVLVNR